MEHFDVIIIGAGVVGLAIASELATAYKTIILERNHSYGLETSSYGSGVIHSGIYYEPNSNKARFCVEGNKLLYKMAADNQIPHKRIGKFVVAVNDAEVPRLGELLARGKENGVKGLEIISGEDVRKEEPHISAVAALRCPSSGIIDQMALMKVFLGKAKGNGAIVAFNTEVRGIERTAEGYMVTAGDDSITSKFVINSAGLFADKVAQMAGLDTDAAGYRQVFSKGSYYAVVNPEKKKLVRKLIYPLPPQEGSWLGIHITIDLYGNMLLGPDSSAVPKSVSAGQLNYKNDDSGRDKFYREVARFFPALALEDLAPDKVGYRPQLENSKNSNRDFIISEESSKGLPGFVNLLGIESPGLTASPAIARHLKALIDSPL